MAPRESRSGNKPSTQTRRVQYFSNPQRYEYGGLPVYFDPTDGHTSEEAIERMAATIAGDAGAAQEWMDRPNPGLHHRTPRQAYRDGDVSQVIGILANVAGF